MAAVLAEEFRTVAAELRRKAEETADPALRADYDEEARSWRTLADGLAALDLSSLPAAFSRAASR